MNELKLEHDNQASCVDTLIARNNELAEGGREIRSSNSGGRVNFLFIATVMGLITNTSASSLYLCAKTGPSALWAIPFSFNCSNFEMSESDIVSAATISFSRPNAVRYNTPASACKIVSETVLYSVSLLGSKKLKSNLRNTQ